ncbi:MAG: hypothetical protein IMZ62_15640 [Chloroflexi bacterium]|nr:hypothetical protein [Chloroflexota bacterium]
MMRTTPETTATPQPARLVKAAQSASVTLHASGSTKLSQAVRRDDGTATTCLIVTGAAILLNIVAFFTVRKWFWFCDARTTDLSLVQTLVLVDTLLVLACYTWATFRLATSAERQVEVMKTQFFDEKIRELKESKPIVFANQVNGAHRIQNVGDAFAANVWYLVPEHEPLAVGSLGKGE